MSGKITRMVRTGDDPVRVEVYVDGVAAFTVSEELARELGLAVGSMLAGNGGKGGPSLHPTDESPDPGPGGSGNSGASARHGSGDEAGAVKEAALRLLTVRARSVGELRDRLRRGGFGGPQVEEVVESLLAVGLLNDEAFARAWVEEKLRLRPCGPRRLVSELLAHSVPRELAEAVVAEAFRRQPEIDVARRAIASRARASSGRDAAKARARLHSFLLRRGFSYEVAALVLKEIEEGSGGDADA